MTFWSLKNKGFATPEKMAEALDNDDLHSLTIVDDDGKPLSKEKQKAVIEDLYKAWGGFSEAFASARMKGRRLQIQKKENKEPLPGTQTE